MVMIYLNELMFDECQAFIPADYIHATNVLMWITKQYKEQSSATKV